MSAVVATPLESPVEFVRGLPPEQKQAVFLALLRELMAMYGERGLLPIDDENGKPLGYYVPPAAAKARYERLLAEMPPEVRAKMTAPIPSMPFDECLTGDELLALLTQEGVLPPPKS